MLRWLEDAALWLIVIGGLLLIAVVVIYVAFLALAAYS